MTESTQHVTRFAHLLYDTLFFNIFTMEELRNIVQEERLLRWKRFEQGSTIFEEGAVGRHFYIVIQGKVHIMRAGDKAPVRAAIISQGEVFGELVVCAPEKTRRASAIVSHETDAVLCEVDGALLETFPPPLHAKFLKKLLDLVLTRFLGEHSRTALYEEIIVFAQQQGLDVCREYFAYTLATAVSHNNRITQFIKYTDFIVAQKCTPAQAIALLQRLVASAVQELDTLPDEQ
jgi:CRP-like cAMP-binding protein